MLIMGKYLDIIAQAEGCAVSAESAVTPTKSSTPQIGSNLSDTFPRFSRFSRTLSALESRCPELVPTDRWQRCVWDGRRFVAQWGEQAERLGWTSADLFGLLPVPANPLPSFNRLSRYDATGLVWLLDGRPVTGLTADTAAIRGAGSIVTIYRKHNKPALGPTGDSLDDLENSK
jgi:hypothetical protein